MSIKAKQLLDVLRIAPEGLTSKQVSAKLGIATYEASSRLSKLAAYGKIERMKSSLSRRKARWRLKQEHIARTCLNVKLEYSSPLTPATQSGLREHKCMQPTDELSSKARLSRDPKYEATLPGL